MHHDNTTNRDNDGTCGDTGGPGCCDTGAPESAAACPCKGVFKSHRLAAALICAAVALAVLISQAGGVLGIVAFVRTL
jgi:hypothetical protein